MAPGFFAFKDLDCVVCFLRRGGKRPTANGGRETTEETDDARLVAGAEGDGVGRRRDA